MPVNSTVSQLTCLSSGMKRTQACECNCTCCTPELPYLSQHDQKEGEGEEHGLVEQALRKKTHASTSINMYVVRADRGGPETSKHVARDPSKKPAQKKSFVGHLLVNCFMPRRGQAGHKSWVVLAARWQIPLPCKSAFSQAQPLLLTCPPLLIPHLHAHITPMSSSGQDTGYTRIPRLLQAACAAQRHPEKSQ